MSVVECKNIKKEYKVGSSVVHALRDVDLVIEKGEFMAIVGPSGSGKSTLLNLIGCLDKPTSGEVKINDVLIKTQTKNALADIRRDNIGFVFQTFNLIPVLTAIENVSFALSLKKGVTDQEVRDKAMGILKEVGLEGLENRKPTELSGGEQQRVAIARALVKEPTLVLADEPTANLDSTTGEGLMKLMQELNKKKKTTFVFSTHDKMVMDYADRVVLLHDGTISKNGRAK